MGTSPRGAIVWAVWPPRCFPASLSTVPDPRQFHGSAVRTIASTARRVAIAASAALRSWASAASEHLTMVGLRNEGQDRRLRAVCQLRPADAACRIRFALCCVSVASGRRRPDHRHDVTTYSFRQPRPAGHDQGQIGVGRGSARGTCSGRIWENLCINCCAQRCALAKIRVFVENFVAWFLIANPPS
jgi:hypothetical protein